MLFPNLLKSNKLLLLLILFLFGISLFFPLSIFFVLSFLFSSLKSKSISSWFSLISSLIFLLSLLLLFIIFFILLVELFILFKFLLKSKIGSLFFISFFAFSSFFFVSLIFLSSNLSDFFFSSISKSNSKVNSSSLFDKLFISFNSLLFSVFSSVSIQNDNSFKFVCLFLSVLVTLFIKSKTSIISLSSFFIFDSPSVVKFFIFSMLSS